MRLKNKTDMEFENATAQNWTILESPKSEDPTVYKVTTGLLLTAAIVTLAFIQHCKRNRKNERGNSCCQQRLETGFNRRLVPDSWWNLFPRKHIDSPKVGLLQSTYTPCQSENSSPAMPVRLKRKYRTNLALGNKLVDLSKHGYMVTRTKKCRTEHGQSVTEISQTDVPGQNSQLQLETPNQNPSDINRRKKGPAGSSHVLSGPENTNTNMCQVELYRDMTKALGSTEMTDSSIRRGNRTNANTFSSNCILQNCQGELNSDGRKGIPELQVNGIAYSPVESSTDMDGDYDKKDCSSLDGDEEEDEGQLQCALKYDQKSAALILHSVCVKTNLDPGIPGFLVEISLLPHRSQTARSKVYVTARREVDITLRETFRLRCTKDDIASNTLSIAVKPMFCSTILYAETDLNELTLVSGKEIFLGGYLKSLSHHFN